MSDFLTKKNNSGGLSHDSGMAPMQPKTKQQPAHGVHNTTKQSYANTKSVNSHTPHGKPHAKVVGKSPTEHGKYL